MLRQYRLLSSRHSCHRFGYGMIFLFGNESISLSEQNGYMYGKGIFQDPKVSHHLVSLRKFNRVRYHI